MTSAALDEVWTLVGDQRWFARFHAAPSGGRGLPVVLVHGFGVSGAYFVPLARELEHVYDTYAPDLPGHGKSDAPARPLDIEGLANALAAWLDVMRLGPARLIGHSMGCQIVAELALRRPDLVERLVLIGPTMDARARSLLRTLPRFIAGGLRESPGVGLVLVKDYVKARRALRTELRTMFAYPTEDAIARLDCVPLQLVRGEHDRVAPDEWLAALARLVPRAAIAVVPGAAHAAHFGAPAELARRVRPFLDAAPGATPPARGAESSRPDSGCRSAPR